MTPTTMNIRPARPSQTRCISCGPNTRMRWKIPERIMRTPSRTATTFREPVGWKLTTRPRIKVRAPRISVVCHDSASSEGGDGCASFSPDSISAPPLSFLRASALRWPARTEHGRPAGSCRYSMRLSPVSSPALDDSIRPRPNAQWSKGCRSWAPRRGMLMTEGLMGPGALRVASPLRTPRAAALAGIVFSVLLTSALLLLRISVPPHPAVPGSWLTDSRRRAAVAIALNLVPFAGIAFLWFIGVLRDRIGEREDRFFATVFLGSGLLFVAMIFAAAAIAGGLIEGESSTPPGAGTLALGRNVTAILVNVYAGFLAHADHHIGRLLDYLEESGQRENTMVIVVSDNGASGEGGPNGSGNEMLFANGIPDNIQANLAMLDELGGTRTYNHYPNGWAMAFNTPFKMWKRYEFNGGTADPCIISWPSATAGKGEIRHQYHHAIDIVPTILDTLGVDPPATIKGHVQSRFDGVSMRYSVEMASAPSARRTQFFSMLGSRGIWHDGWKAVTTHPTLSGWSNFNDDTWELYHTDTDRSEVHDLAAEHPEKVRELVNLWFAEAGDNGVFPLDDRSALEIITTPRPQLASPRDRYAYFPDTAEVPEAQAVNVRNRSFTIGALVDIPAAGAQGVL